jgi:hypothetical protein
VSGADVELFVHVLAAIVLFAAIGAVAVITLATAKVADQGILARASLGTLLLGAVPAWLAMFVFGSWTKSTEHWGDTRWLSIGSGIAGAGIAILLVSCAVAYAWTRKPAGGWQPVALRTLTLVYLVALGVAWWVMSAKAPS